MLGFRFQDGAATANNPAMLALQQARLLWPDTQIECLVSIGSGTVPVHKREKSMSAYVDTGNVLIESACSVDKVAGALAATAPMIPGLTYYRWATASISDTPVSFCNPILEPLTGQASMETCMWNPCCE